MPRQVSNGDADPIDVGWGASAIDDLIDIDALSGARKGKLLDRQKAVSIGVEEKIQLTGLSAFKRD